MSIRTLLAGTVVVAFLALFFLALPTPEATAGHDDATPAPPSGAFAITNVRLFDGHDVIESATVVVRDGRIESVGSRIEPPSSLALVDGSGKTLLPGLIDSHTHTWNNALVDSLRFGVTTSLDMFTEKAFAATKRDSRDSFDRKDEADLYSAGTLVTVAGGHGTEYGMSIPTLDASDDAAEFVRQRIAEGSDFIKIVSEDGRAWGMDTPTLDGTRIAAVVKAAHDQERLALVHVSTLEAGHAALSAGADGLVHTFGDREVDDLFLELAKSSGAFVVSTITLLDHLDRVESGNPLVEDPAVEHYLSTAQKESLFRSFPFSARSLSHGMTALENLRRLHEAGVPILAGTDAPNPGTAHGVSLHAELARLVDAGLTPVEALRSATSLPAERFGLENRGCVAAGCRADLVMVDGDPTTNIADSRQIVAIWKNGYSIERKLVTASASNPSINDHELVSDFESREIETAFGSGWMATTDKMMDGTSTADLSIVASGASSSTAALRVTGSIGKGFPFPWAGAIVFPGPAPMQPVDATSKAELVFWVRSNQKELRVMAFAESLGQRPAEKRVPVSSKWTEVRVPFREFGGLDAAGLQAFAVSGGPDHGEFWFEIDDVRLR